MGMPRRCQHCCEMPSWSSPVAARATTLLASERTCSMRQACLMDFSMALHSIYCILNGLSRQTPIEIEKLVWHISEKDTEWLGRVKRLVMMITGTVGLLASSPSTTSVDSQTRESLLDLARVHNLIMEHRRLTSSESARSNSSDKSPWRIAEIEGQLDFLDGELQNDVPDTLEVGNAESAHRKSAYGRPKLDSPLQSRECRAAAVCFVLLPECTR